MNLSPLSILGGSATPQGCRVSIIIPLFNAVEFTAALLPHLLASIDSSDEVICIDNGSTDSTAALLEKYKGRIGIINNRVNRNFSGACNQGAEKATGRVIIFLNNDTMVQNGWWQPMVSRIEDDETIGVCGNLQIFPDNNRVHHAGIYFDSAGQPRHYLENVDIQDPRVHYQRDFSAVTGACLAIRRSLFREMGGFDEEYRNGYEDIDLCLRLKDQGYRIVYVPESRIWHHVSKSPGRSDHSNSNFTRFNERWRARISPDRELYEESDKKVILDSLLTENYPHDYLGILISPEGTAFSLDAAFALREAIIDSKAAREVVVLVPKSLPLPEDAPYTTIPYSAQFSPDVIELVKQRYHLKQIVSLEKAPEHLPEISRKAVRRRSCSRFLSYHHARQLLRVDEAAYVVFAFLNKASRLVEELPRISEMAVGKLVHLVLVTSSSTADEPPSIPAHWELLRLRGTEKLDFLCHILACADLVFADSTESYEAKRLLRLAYGMRYSTLQKTVVDLSNKDPEGIDYL